MAAELSSAGSSSAKGSQVFKSQSGSAERIMSERKQQMEPALLAMYRIFPCSQDCLLVAVTSGLNSCDVVVAQPLQQLDT
mmetsp:Transcript_21785/g.45792  ORF Transcript_21785/g.45792 Transcript_21785/m.45792 type:complete len:80 (-) Transcript_21785:68-307(-)